ncbi:hypothetical protein VTK73DRAFT_5192 [Phialemonium thermophilum]|uniref:Uncharacterized protein n=1 Tax=Phialemonium thermophilum TaxID=223376 RepID=A0ABR3WPI4_9PEZI
MPCLLSASPALPFQVCDIQSAPGTWGDRPLHFVHFTVQDFESCSGAGDDSFLWDDEWRDTISSPPPLSFDSGSPSQTSPSSLSLSLVEEPSWFAPLDISSQYDEVLFTYYVLEICPRGTMYDDSSNGFRTIIIPMSANHPSVMHSILSVAAFYRRYEDPAYHVRALEQKENALIHLRRGYPDDPGLKHEEMIAAAIMLCVFEIKDGSGPNWDRHIHGGRSILRAKVHTDGSEVWADGISWWANKFFGYQYVIGSSSETMEDASVFTSPAFWLSQGMDFQEIDGFMGCSSELMATTAEVSILSKDRYAGRITEEHLHAKTSDLEHRLFHLRQRSMHIPMVLSEDSNLVDAINSCLVLQDTSVRAKMLLLTAEARRHAALVFLYACVRGIPMAHSAVQSRVSRCLLCMSAVSKLMASDDSPIWGMTPLIWPLFVSGACALGDHERFQVANIFSLLRKTKCLGNVSRAEDTLKAVWKQHDVASGGHQQQQLSRLFVEPNVKWPLSLG